LRIVLLLRKKVSLVGAWQRCEPVNGCSKFAFFPNGRMITLEPAWRTYGDNGISGSKGRDKRPGLDAMLRDAKRRKFDLVSFWSIDRLGRSTSTVANTMDELAEAGVAMFAFKESMDTGTAHGRAMLEMAAVFARLERQMIRDRVVAGLRPAAAEGKKLGRPTGNERDKARARAGARQRAAILEARKAGKGKVKIAKELGVVVGTVSRVIAEAATPSG
jgi:DNA invertase Pin-like site-specific DNA recombinase